MSTVRQQLQYGQKFWAKGRKQPNGKVVDIDWPSEEIQVRYYDTNEIESFTFDELDGKWTDRYGGTWYITQEP